MNLTLQQFERIEAYLSEDASATEKRSFEDELRQDAALQAELDVQKSFRFGLSTLALQHRIEAAHQRYASQEPEVVAFVPIWKNYFGTLAVAASVAFILGLGWLYQSQYYISGAVLAVAHQEMSLKSVPFEMPKNSSQADKNRLNFQRADWFFALAFIQKGEKQKAKTILTRMSKTDGHLYQDKAKKLLEKM